jgi:4-amino-4-deoxy-L-arabinose transferase-like glycosyltransferase
MHKTANDWHRVGASFKFLKHRLHWLLLVLTLILCLLRFAWLRADFPNHSPWMIDQAKFTDEGWWASAASRHFLIGHWDVPGDYNPAIAVPAWPLLLTFVFHFTGVSLTAARAVSVLFSIATVALVFFLLRRYGGTTGQTTAVLGALSLAASPFAFAFSRLATLDTVIVFEFCLLLWIAACVDGKRLWPLLTLGVLIPITVLTKTTALVLLPAVFWVLFAAARPRSLRSILLVGGIAGALLGGYLSSVSGSRWADDYHYFFEINALAEVDWSQTRSFLLQLFHHGMWVDPILYPVALVVLLLSLTVLRGMWKNPLFTASCIAIAAQVVFILRRQDDYAPRYFLTMLVPVVLILALVLADLQVHHRKMAALLGFAIAIAVVVNIVHVCGFLAGREYQFYSAAKSIETIVKSERNAHPLLLGSSGDQMTLMTGIPSINDGYSSQDLAQKVAHYQPGWYVGWNDLDQDILAELSAYRLDKVATFKVFDHDKRDWLTLYRMVPVPTP